MKKIPAIRAVMTPFPYSIESGRSVIEAQAMMESHDIRHLPVVEQGRLTGVVTARDIAMGLDPAVGSGPSGELQVGDVCGMEVLTAESTEPLDRVLRQMAERHVGATLVMKEGRLVGIFTMTDACRRFAELLASLFPKKGGDEAA